MSTTYEKTTTILGIETSCDETAAAVVRDGKEVLSNVISSQIDVHTLYGGVVPEIASRLHIEGINAVTRAALSEANLTFNDIDVIAVTKGPGLVGALLCGVSFAKGISFALNKTLIGVNHIEGHIAANYLSHPKLKPPYLCLVVSGGHTELIVVKDFTKFELLGSTMDDAAGESFDKVARALGLEYPGGPKVDEAAKKGNPHAYEFPRTKVDGHPYDFSFSGLKSSVLNYINTAHMTNETINISDLCASFEAAAIESLTKKTVDCALSYNIKILSCVGGVSSNTYLRHEMMKECSLAGISCLFPEKIYCTDNAAMIAAAGYYEYISGTRDDESLDALPNLKLREFQNE